MLAEVVAIAGPLVPCMPDWAPERSAYIVVFEAAVAENILAEHPQLRNRIAQVLDARSLVTRVAVLFSAPDGKPLGLFSHDGSVPSASVACAAAGYVLAGFFDPFED